MTLPTTDYRRSRVPGAINLAQYNVQELITNGTFDSDVTGWTASSPATISWSSSSGGTMYISRANASIDTDMCYQDIKVIPNEWYRFVITCTSQDWDGVVDFEWDGAPYVRVIDMLTTGTFQYIFKATAHSLRVIVKPTTNLTAVLYVDNISLIRLPGTPWNLI